MNRSAARAAAVAVAALLLTGPACSGRPSPVVSPETVTAPPPEFVPVPASEMPIAAEPAAPDVPLPPYVVAVEDVIEISLYGDPEMTRVIPVRPDGKISYTFVGDVQAAGRSIEEIRAELTTRLSVYLRSPEVTVIAREFGRSKVYVGGEVRQPGVFYITPRENTLADVVFRAGLTTERADLDKAVLVRAGRIVPVDFNRVLRGDLGDNITLSNNDLVFVPEATDRYIYVLGEVRQQNALETSSPLPILAVLSRSGGVNQGTAKSKEIAVLRGGLKEPKVAVVNYRRLVEGDFSQNIQVQPGDIVYVPTTGLGRYNQFVEQILRTFTLLFQGRVVQQGFQ